MATFDPGPRTGVFKVTGPTGGETFVVACDIGEAVNVYVKFLHQYPSAVQRVCHSALVGELDDLNGAKISL